MDRIKGVARGMALSVAAVGLGASLAGCGGVTAGLNSILEPSTPNPPRFLAGGQVEPFVDRPLTNADIDCPQVDVPEGGAALRGIARGGDPESVRSQITIANLARECDVQPDGSIRVKIGVEGRVLLGPGGAPGRFDAPVRFVVKRGQRVFGDRSRRTAVAVPAGDTQASFTVVEDGFVVPAGVRDFEIEVSLASGPSERAAGRRRG